MTDNKDDISLSVNSNNHCSTSVDKSSNGRETADATASAADGDQSRVKTTNCDRSLDGSELAPVSGEGDLKKSSTHKGSNQTLDLENSKYADSNCDISKDSSGVRDRIAPTSNDAMTDASSEDVVENPDKDNSFTRESSHDKHDAEINNCDMRKSPNTEGACGRKTSEDEASKTEKEAPQKALITDEEAQNFMNPSTSVSMTTVNRKSGFSEGSGSPALQMLNSYESPGGTSAEESDATKRKKKKEEKRSKEGSSQESSSDEEVDMAAEGEGRRWRKRPRRARGASSTSSSSTEGPDIENGFLPSHDEEEEEDDEDIVEEPEDLGIKDTWTPLITCRKREYGASNRLPLGYQFRQQAKSSISLVQRFRKQYELNYHEGCVNSLHFNEQGTLLASGSDDLNVVLWNWTQNKPYLVYDSGHRSNIFQSKFMPYSGDCHVISSARDGMIRMAELSSTGVCKGTKKIGQHKGAANKVALMKDSAHVVYSCGEDAAVFEIDLRQNKPVKLCTTKQNDRKVPLYSIQANPMKSYEFCVGGRDPHIRIYDRRMLGDEGSTQQPIKKFCPHHLVDSEYNANVTCAVYNYNGTEVLGTYNDDDIYLFDMNHSDGADSIHRYSGHRNNATVKGVNFYGSKSEFVVSGSDCHNVFIWHKETEKVVNYFYADSGGVVNGLEPHPSLPVLATSGLDHDIKIWTPTANEAAKLHRLKQVQRKNKKQRENERVHEPDMLDGQMFWYLMQYLRRSARRRAQTAGEDYSSSENSSDADSEPDSDDMENQAQFECAPS